MEQPLRVNNKMRFDVLERDGFQCQYCGAAPPNAVLHVDHIVPVVLGGENGTDNLITSCSGCNFAKGSRLLTTVPKSQSISSLTVKTIPYVSADIEALEEEPEYESMTLLEYIEENYGTQARFARAIMVQPQQVSQWLNKGFIVVNDSLYSPRRVLK